MGLFLRHCLKGQWLSTFDIGPISQCSCYDVAVLNDARNVLISFDVANIPQKHEKGKIIVDLPIALFLLLGTNVV